MSTPTLPSDRNLLFGLLALQMDFVTRDQLLEGMNAWMLSKGTPLGEILKARGVLAEDDRDDVERLVAKHLKRHGGDPRTSLAAVPVDPAMRRALDRVADVDVQASVSVWATRIGADDDRTTAPVSEPFSPQVRYRRLRPLARGGLGEVSVARDEELSREVALKEIQERFADQGEARARFVREAEVTGQLEHPGIVPVYGLGAYPDGRPFYAMRLIRGTAMSEAIAALHGKAAQDSSRMALRDLLTRFVAVCNAIAYAHTKGVIHRDLKPANVMLGDFGETLVVDWGLARFVQQAEADPTEVVGSVRLSGESSGLATEMGKAVGTPAYMAPEQALGQHDREGPTTDVFALGAMLYALLTGHAPYSGTELGEVLRQAERAEVTPARQRNAQVPRPLEAVCARAMAAKPADRYAGAMELAEDVRRWLADEQVLAYREPVADRARRWARRHRTLVASALVLLLVGLVSLGIGLIAVRKEQALTEDAWEKEKERRIEAETNLARAVKAEEQSKHNLDRAEANLKLARDAIEQCYDTAIKSDLFQKPGMQKARNLLLANTLPFFSDFHSQRPDDPKFLAEEVKQYRRVGHIQSLLGNLTDARKAYEKAESLHITLIKANPDSAENLVLLGSTNSNLGNVLLRLGERAEAERQFQLATKFLSQAIKDHPKMHEYRGALALAHFNLGGLMSEQDKKEAAEKEYRQAQLLLQDLVRSNPEVIHYQNELAGTYHNLGALLEDQNKPDQAEAEFRKARSLRLKLANEYGEDPRYKAHLAASHNHLGNVLGMRGKPQDALREYRLARDQLTQVVAADPDVLEYQAYLADTHNNLANVLKQLGKPEEALEEYQQAYAFYSQAFKADPNAKDHHAGLIQICLNRGGLLLQLNRLGPSLADLDQAYSLLGELRRRDARSRLLYPYLRAVLFDRAIVHTRLGNKKLGDEDWTRLLTIVPPGEKPKIRKSRVVHQARAGDYLRAATEAEELSCAADVDGEILFDLACVQAINAVAAGRDRSRPLPERDKRAEEYSLAAMELLRRAADGGFFRGKANLGYLDKDADLDGLRGRDDYRALRAAIGP